MKYFLKTLVALFLTVNLYADKNIPFLDFVENLSLHNNINIFVDSNLSTNISFFVPEHAKKEDYFDIFKMTLFKNNFDLKLIGEVYYIKPIDNDKLILYSVQLNNNSIVDISKYLKFNNIKFEYINASNKVILYTFPNKLLRILKNINNLDVVKKQISLKFTIIEITDDNIDKIGLNFKASNTSITSNISSIVTAIYNPQINNNLIFSSSNFNAFLEFSNEKNYLNISQNPYVLVQDRSNFIFEAVTNIPFIISETQTDSNFNSSTARVDYKDVGLKIQGSAFINDGLINLDLNVSVEDILSITDNRPTTFKRTLKSNASLKRGQVLLLSGIKQTKSKKTDFSVPFISNIPYLGEIFKYKSDYLEVSNLSIAIEILDDVDKKDDGSILKITNEWFEM